MGIELGCRGWFVVGMEGPTLSVGSCMSTDTSIRMSGGGIGAGGGCGMCCGLEGKVIYGPTLAQDSRLWCRSWRGLGPFCLTTLRSFLVNRSLGVHLNGPLCLSFHLIGTLCLGFHLFVP